MAGYTIHAPQADYSGISAGVQFADGVAWTDNDAAVGYFRESGYTVAKGGKPPELVPLSIDPSPARGPASRDAAVVRDAAGPMSDAFMPPTNVGDGHDPHGPLVVSPGLHALPPAPIVPGPVSSDAVVQEQVETEVAVTVLVENADVGDAIPTDATPAGPLDLSDPASVGEGPDAAEGEWTKERLLDLADERGADVNRRLGVAKLREELGV